MTRSAPLRSVLYVPCDKPRALEKARMLLADALILDLEDAVAPEQKEKARDALVSTLKSGGFGHKTICVRVNALSTPWGLADVQAIAALSSSVRPAAVALPKASTAADIHELAALLPPEIEIWPTIETPLGVLNAAQIAAAGPQVSVLVMGTSDLVKDLRARHVPEREPLLYSLSHVVLAARAYGLRALDGVHLDLEDEAGFQASCVQGRALGFDGKTLIHPKTIEAANKAFAPTETDILNAQLLCEAWASRGDKSVIVVSGQLVEHLHILEAERVLALAAQIAKQGKGSCS